MIVSEPGFEPGGVSMGGCCGCKKWLKLIAGLVLILVSANMLQFSPWLIVGLYLALAGLMPMMCQCEACEMKKKK